ncbi:ammonia-forming cytochrome c nitrite reductase subunit c552 [Bdellovibrio sp. HCB337]|uniref:ammonia-forming cytochrome c nitrite reductase subunit c552 n=1 Tax=Bdellovibrio sp. HCB337 TaxID=3394358 RepID=UPI0039A659CA
MKENILKSKTFWLMVLISSAVTAFAVFMIMDISEKKLQAHSPFQLRVPITDDVDDPAIWGQNFPDHYQMYLQTVDQTRTKYGGSEALPHIPTDKDPRGQVSQSRLDEDPRLKVMWAGYAFSVDFREERGHAYMLTDQFYTERQHVTKQPGTCLNCHASTYVYMKKLGNGNIMDGFEKMNQLPYFEAAKHVKHPVSCIDCHEPQTMKLRVTKPAFIEGIKLVKKNAGISEYDVNHQASPQQMRVFVCAQCHVEYYFKGPEKRLTFPWAKGLRADNILALYEENGHKDWEHKITGAPALKAQHPEFEMYSQGIHARSGVSCVDCHMPYKRVGAMKLTDHHVRSPVLNLSHSCQTCHQWPEAELKARVESIQDRTFEVRGIALNALNEYIQQLGESKDKIKSKKDLEKAQNYQRKAQFLVDFVEAENSMGFHAPGEALRILSLSLDYSRQGQNFLNRVSTEPSAKKPESVMKTSQ